MMPTTDKALQRNVSRRRAMQLGAAAALTLAAGAGTAAAEEEPYFGTGYVQSPWIETDYTIAEHRADFLSPLAYVADNGEEASLGAHGGRLAEGEDDEPHNPLTLRADRVAADEYLAFPRGETYEDADGEDQDLNWYDDQHWSGDLTVATTSPANGEDGLEVSGIGTATFDGVDLTSGIPRRYLQLVVDVDSLAGDSEIYLRVHDSGSNTVETWIDSAADESSTGTIATAEGKGVVYQVQLGEFAAGDDLEDISSVEIEITTSSATITLVGLNLDRESRWEFGTREFLNADDELETETVREPSGEFSVVGMATSENLLPDPFGDAAVMDLGVDLEFHSEDVPSDQVAHMWEDADRYSEEFRLHTLVGFELPTAYDLSPGDATLRDEVLYPDSRYLTAEYGVDIDEFPTFEDVDDEDMVSRETTYSGVGDSVTITSDVAAGELLVLHFDVLLTASDREEATTAPGGGGGPTSSGSFFGVTGILLSAVGGIVGYLAWAHRKATDAVGR